MEPMLAKDYLYQAWGGPGPPRKSQPVGEVNKSAGKLPDGVWWAWAGAPVSPVGWTANLARGAVFELGLEG